MPNYEELTCTQCSKKFQREVGQANQTKNRNCLPYCSIECVGKSNMKQLELECEHCHTKLWRTPAQVRQTKSGRVFCNKSCSATYNNKNKTHGNRRSKLEKWLEKELTKLYPNLDIVYNQKDAINSELDIYIPSLKLAFELNGIFHYEPIFGDEKLNQIQNNDERKFQACLEQDIELCIIDTSQHKYVTPKTSQKYLDIIIKIIQQKIK